MGLDLHMSIGEMYDVIRMNNLSLVMSMMRFAMIYFKSLNLQSDVMPLEKMVCPDQTVQLYNVLSLVERVVRSVQDSLIGRANGAICTRCSGWHNKLMTEQGAPVGRADVAIYAGCSSRQS